MKTLVILFVVFLVACCTASRLQNGPNKSELPSSQLETQLPNLNISKENGGGGWSSGSLHYGQPPRCVALDGIPDFDAWDRDFFSRQRLWYYSGGTDYGYSLVYRIFNGHFANSQVQLDEMCPTITYSTKVLASSVIYSGSGRQFLLNCNTTGPFCYIEKDPQTYDEGVDVFYALGRQDYYMLDTDNKTYAIYYVCNDNTSGNLILLTTRPYASPKVFRKLLSFFSRFNIQTSNARASICSAPTFHEPYPHPFENYPNSAGGGWSNSNGWGANSPPTNSGWGQEQSNGWSVESDWAVVDKKTELGA